MPSYDEQKLWDDLQRFPDHVLSWERKQVMIKNIREKGKQMEKREGRRKAAGWVANGLITCAALFVFIWMNQLPAPSETSGNQTAVEQKYVVAAQKEIQALGLKKEFQFDELKKGTEYDIVQTKNREAIVTFLPDTTEVRSVSATVAFDELGDRYQPYAETAREAWKATNQPFSVEHVHLYTYSQKTTLFFQFKADQFVSVDLATNQVTDFSIDYRPEDVEQRFVSLAQEALKPLANADRFAFTDANRALAEKEEVWTLANEQEKYSVQIGAQTGRVYSVTHVADQYAIPSIHEAVSVPKPLVAQIFGIDLTGYEAYGGKDWGGYVLKRQGNPNVVIHIQDLDKGNIGKISVEW